MDAKYRPDLVLLDDLVSIHAPVMDANLAANAETDAAYRFNPRARDGREDMFIYVYPTPGVSIHAPVMDANCIFLTKSCYQWFQSTRP